LGVRVFASVCLLDFPGEKSCCQEKKNKGMDDWGRFGFLEVFVVNGEN